ncbi:hypothetical protein L226DRAFT_329936 [Lentinus tigrinus ALCF2SS1-7]|uniref:Uncharacterized protein n=1 Tax=Lentinus tigrinus ALCF2SS1-6 TaxID=1328759 RepID=A0A5C2SGY1_9APHY|nr:hypothetical protein L227DRAFT_38377 [Lentinus tigrinus ALCF2SS1-6]RPD77709.1 hypothetical protein L226DRAFT_329936 [Lentinus tigrinus ALCF2SS1-7]
MLRILSGGAVAVSGCVDCRRTATRRLPRPSYSCCDFDSTLSVRPCASALAPRFEERTKRGSRSNM